MADIFYIGGIFAEFSLNTIIIYYAYILRIFHFEFFILSNARFRIKRKRCDT